MEATRNLATAAPEGVNRSSGSSTRLPAIVVVTLVSMVFSLAVRTSGRDRNGSGATVRGEVTGPTCGGVTNHFPLLPVQQRCRRSRCSRPAGGKGQVPAGR